MNPRRLASAVIVSSVTFVSVIIKSSKAVVILSSGKVGVNVNGEAVSFDSSVVYIDKLKYIW